MIRSLIEKKLQAAVNHFLALDPESHQKIQALNGKIITVRLSETPLVFQLAFHENQVNIITGEPNTAHTLITGTPFSLAHLSLVENRKSFFKEDVTLEGDAECGQQVIDLFDSLDIDWEEYLSHWIGDGPAHEVGRLARKFMRFKQHLGKSLAQNLDEYIHEEIQLFPQTEALEDFFQDIDALRMDTDRLEMRILELENKAEPL